MNKFTKDLAVEAGFKIFGNTIVAADNGSSGDATKCLDRFAQLLIAECMQICNNMANSAEYSYTPAKTVVAEKTAKGCAELISRKFE
jgi:hypothetical protein